MCPMTQDCLLDKMISNIKEGKARGAMVMAITQERRQNMERMAVVVAIPDVDSLLAPIATVTPLQLFAYYMAVARGCDLDKPRNLVKNVTVK